MDEAKQMKPQGLSDGEWDKFRQRVVFEDLYFDWTVVDEQELG
jgi:hypothetical protein